MMTLTDDQRLLQDTVRPFMADEGAIRKQLRQPSPATSASTSAPPITWPPTAASPSAMPYRLIART